MTDRGEVLVAILNNVLDFKIARDKHWYRIPKDPKGLKKNDLPMQRPWDGD
jgi:hypothetical protein